MKLPKLTFTLPRLFTAKTLATTIQPLEPAKLSADPGYLWIWWKNYGHLAFYKPKSPETRALEAHIYKFVVQLQNYRKEYPVIHLTAIAKEKGEFFAELLSCIASWQAARPKSERIQAVNELNKFITTLYYPSSNQKFADFKQACITYLQELKGPAPKRSFVLFVKVSNNPNQYQTAKAAAVHTIDEAKNYEEIIKQMKTFTDCWHLDKFATVDSFIEKVRGSEPSYLPRLGSITESFYSNRLVIGFGSFLLPDFYAWFDSCTEILSLLSC